MPTVIDGVTVALGGKTVLDNLSFILPDKGTVALFGPSGSGKTTFLRLIAGLIRPEKGSVKLPDGARVAFVFQEPRLLPWLSAEENVASVGADAERAKELLRALGIDGDDLKKRPGELSGGMKQRVSIARALAYGGNILLLDEPFTGLDSANAAAAKELIFSAAADRLTVYSTHDPCFANEADTVITFGAPAPDIKGDCSHEKD